jgi:hypothetical protein
MLQHARITEHMVLIVPAPPETVRGTLHAAWDAWQTARQAMNNGRWADAIAATRKVYELVGAATDPVTAPRERSKEERWQSVGAALFRLASAPVHADEVTLGMDWTRDDSVAAVNAGPAVNRRGRLALPRLRPGGLAGGRCNRPFAT